MKRILLLAAVALVGAGSVCAALTEADLTTPAISRAIRQKPEGERQAFAREVFGAIAAQPIDDAAKTQAFVSAARALIDGAGKQTVHVIAETFNSVPVAQLQGVADLLATVNFDQRVHEYSDADYNKVASAIVKSASQYIEASGADSPAVRMGILAASFTKGSQNPERTRPIVIAALPTSVQAAATTYMGASEQGNREMIADAAGVDAVEPTPADPDAASVVPAATAATTTAAAAAPAEPAAEAAATAEEDAPAAKTANNGGGTEVKVPLLSRWAADHLGLTFDAMRAATYDWAAVEDPASVRTDPVVPTLPGFGNVVGVPGEQFPAGQPLRKPGVSLPLPSPGYGNQRIR